jgi:hypothetical protein
VSGDLGQTITDKGILEDIERLLRDYSWMVREIHRLEKSLYGGGSTGRSWGVAQYGLEAAMPKGSGGISKVELAAMDEREERIFKRIKKLTMKVEAVEYAAEHIEGEMHKVVFDCLVEGMSYREISKHLGVSRTRVSQIKTEVMNQISRLDQIRQVVKN